jgi:hypothetical protein
MLGYGREEMDREGRMGRRSRSGRDQATARREEGGEAGARAWARCRSGVLEKVRWRVFICSVVEAVGRGVVCGDVRGMGLPLER